MKNTSEMQALTMYGIYYLVMEQLFMLLFEFFNEMGAVLILLIFLILIPLLSCMISCRLAFKNKRISITSSLNKNIILAVIISYLVSYFLIYNLNILTLGIHAIMFIFVYKHVKKTINKSIINETNNNGVNENFGINYNENLINGLNADNFTGTFTGSLIKKHKLEKFDDENISKFLVMNNLNPSNYAFGTVRQNTASILMLTPQGSALTERSVIVAYDENRLYIFEFSMLSGKEIVNAYTIEKSEMKKCKDSKMFGIHTLTLVGEGKDVYILSLLGKVKGIPDHKEKVERLVAMYT